MPMKITPSDNEVLVTLSGELFAEEAGKLHSELLKHCERGVRIFKIDTSELIYIDSSGLGALVAVYKKNADIGGSLQISGLKGDVKQLFELTSLNKVFDIRD